MATVLSGVAKTVSTLLPIVPNASVSMTQLSQGRVKYKHQPPTGDNVLPVTRFGLWTPTTVGALL